jgi:hypothetical protein
MEETGPFETPVIISPPDVMSQTLILKYNSRLIVKTTLYVEPPLGCVFTCHCAQALMYALAGRRGSTHKDNALGTFLYVTHVCNIIHEQMDAVFLYSSRANSATKKSEMILLRRNPNRQKKSTVAELKVTATTKKLALNCIHSSQHQTRSALPHILPYLGLCLPSVRRPFAPYFRGKSPK